jgi:hypothetical protein
VFLEKHSRTPTLTKPEEKVKKTIKSTHRDPMGTWTLADEVLITYRLVAARKQRQ